MLTLEAVSAELMIAYEQVVYEDATTLKTLASFSKGNDLPSGSKTNNRSTIKKSRQELKPDDIVVRKDIGVLIAQNPKV